ncbi:hypothetical protein DFH09DRAFT_1315632 [Mycena vulgaris]|nr:hypothetical protein DFH09DRAFT_1315632 [Mycena vulgaris]
MRSHPAVLDRVYANAQTTALESRFRVAAQGHLVDALDNSSRDSVLATPVSSLRLPTPILFPTPRPTSNARSTRLAPLTPCLPASPRLCAIPCCGSALGFDFCDLT